MRLIDADKLPWVDRVILLNKVDGDINITIAKEYTSYVNDETPTVDAIPIEWLINKCNEADNMGMGIDDWSMKDCYQLVLEQWEKENECNNKYQ